MTPEIYLNFLEQIGKLKSTYRHSFTDIDRPESVAEHSWRTAVMALILSDKISGVDINKVIKMCLIHDFGESITGDIPVFLKTTENEQTENFAIIDILNTLPPNSRAELNQLFEEIESGITLESKLFKALDKLEAIVQHNSAPLHTWLELEKTLNLTYGETEAQNFEFLKDFRSFLRQKSLEKLKKGE